MIVSQKETVPDTTIFNDEELFYMNRIAFAGFKRWGHNFAFKRFIDNLMTLQTGRFKERLELWLTLVNESEEVIKGPSTDNINLNQTVISKQKFTNVIRASFP